ncbi:MAG: glycosyltransferase family 4 protein [Oligoflexus sp.]
MKIAQVSPLSEAVPPKLYGGTERVIHYLTEALVEDGHEVTLFASGDSQCSATLHSVCDQAIRLDGQVRDPLALHYCQLKDVMDLANEFDVIHFHTDYLHFPLHRLLQAPSVTTLHGRLDLPELRSLYQRFQEVPVISISNSQRQPLAFANWQGTVYHGLPLDLYQLNRKPEGYLAFVGRISPEKRVDRAIEIAKRSGIPLRIAAKIDKADESYFREEIEHLFQDPIVEFIGEIGDGEKNEFLGNALALLFPIDWPEPFGMVMIESMACGTPVIAMNRGSVAEVITDGISGFVVHHVDEAVEKLKLIPGIDREACRRHFEKRFSSARMAQDYLQIYSEQIGLTQLAV